jgi:hypothetical protein
MPGAGSPFALDVFREARAPPNRYSDAEIYQLGCFRDAAGPNAGSADANVHAHAIDHGANALKIWIPAAAAGIVRVTDHVAERRPLAANLAFHSHDNSSPIPTKLNKVSSLAEFEPVCTGFDCMPMSKFLKIRL